MFRVRFHLANGSHHMHWQIKNMSTGEITYCDPKKTILLMHNCVLRNQAGTARKIYQGADKKVCAWIEADEVAIVAWDYKIDWVRDAFAISRKRLRFNPRIAPHWTLGDSSESVDGSRFEWLDAADSAVFVGN